MYLLAKEIVDEQYLMTFFHRHVVAIRLDKILKLNSKVQSIKELWGYI